MNQSAFVPPPPIKAKNMVSTENRWRRSLEPPTGNSSSSRRKRTRMASTMDAKVMKPTSITATNVELCLKHRSRFVPGQERQSQWMIYKTAAMLQWEGWEGAERSKQRNQWHRRTQRSKLAVWLKCQWVEVINGHYSVREKGFKVVHY